MNLWDWLFRREQHEEELDEEVQAHLQMAAQERMERGETVEQSRTCAVREFGNVTLIKEMTRDMWGFRWLEELLQDLRYGLRQLRRNPGFTTICVITLALGIGANTAVFSVVSAVLIRRLPYQHSDHLVWVMEFWPRINNTVVPSPDFLNWRDQNQVFQDVAPYGGFGELNLSDDCEPERIDGIGVTWDFFPMLGGRSELGRGFLPEEDRPDGPPLVILGHSLWKRRFHSDPNVVGKMITLDEKAYRVIGIMPDSFRFPGDLTPELFAPSYLPLKADWSARELAIVGVIARLKPHVSLGRAKSDLFTINRRSDQRLPPPFAQMGVGLQVRIGSLHEHLVGDARPPLLILWGAVSLVLLLTCANVANLQLARAVSRKKEFAVLAAIGAGSWRLARQLFIESFAIAALGGVAGLILGAGGVALLRQLGPPGILGLRTARLEPWVFAYIAAITAFIGAAFGLAPVFVASKLRLEVTQKEARPSETVAGTALRLRSILMVSEVALALILLTGRGLLIRSFIHLTSVNPGFDQRQVLTERIALPMGKCATPNQQTTFLLSVLEHIGMLAGTESVAASSSPPLTRLTHHAIHGPIWKHDGGGGWGFWGFPVRDDTRGRKSVGGGLIRKDLRAEIGALLPVDIILNETPIHPLFQARKGTPWSWA